MNKVGLIWILIGVLNLAFYNQSVLINSNIVGPSLLISYLIFTIGLYVKRNIFLRNIISLSIYFDIYVLILLLIFATFIFIDFALGYCVLYTLILITILIFSLIKELSTNLIKKIILMIASTYCTLMLIELLLRSDILPMEMRGPLARINSYKDWNKEYNENSKIGYYNYNKYFYKGLSLRTKTPLDNSEKIRIIVLGDSNSWGDKIQCIEDIWPYKVENNLNKINPNYEVINLSLMGASAVNMFDIMDKYGWELRPDIIVWQYFYNDPFPSFVNFTNAGNQSRYINKVNLSPYKHMELSESLYIYSLLDNAYFKYQIKTGSAKELSYFDIHSDIYEGWRITKKRIKDFSLKCKNLNIKVLQFTMPDLREELNPNTYVFQDIDYKISQIALNSGFKTFSFLDKFSDINSTGRYWWVLDWDAHPNIEAHRLIADEVTRQILVNHKEKNKLQINKP